MAPTYGTEGPRCPHCLHLITADEAFYYDESLTQLECYDCDKPFRVRVYNSTSWTCDPLPDEARAGVLDAEQTKIGPEIQ